MYDALDRDPFGPEPSKPMSSSYYRCGNCNLNLPHEDPYKRCPQCRTPTATLGSTYGITVMTTEAAAKLASAAQFERYLEGETESMREARRVKAESGSKASKERASRFAEVIEGAGFQQWERDAIAELEAKLGDPPQLDPLQ